MSDEKKKEPFAPEAMASAKRAPPQIPDHELIRKIGGGSYGEVWLARSIMGTYRAVKVVYRESFDHDRPFEREFNGIQRFEPISRSHESQVDILHVGRNEGYFYYVMELADNAEVPSARCQVSGEDSGEANALASSPDTSHLTPDTYVPRTLRNELFRRGKLPFEECLPIILSLTTALEHLHKHGLVHRDIKPSNIIFVHGIPKLADIGLVTSVDATRSYVGTEGFLPPEGPGTVTADIYSLGKVLYEMSSGRDRQDFPELPTNLGELPDRAGLLELNAMVAKACKNDPRQRYQSAAEMHADLLLLQSGKSVRRLHGMERQLARVTRVGVIAALVAVLAVGAYVIAQNQARRARETAARESKLRQEADAEKKKAQTEAAKSRQVARFFKDTFEAAGPAVAQGRDATLLKEILDKSATRIGNELTNQPEVEAELRNTIGEVRHALGEFAKAEEILREALAILRKLPGNQDHDLAAVLNNLADVLQEEGKLPEALTNASEAVAIARRIPGDERLLASCLNALAVVMSEQGKISDAEVLYRQALELHRKLPETGDKGVAECLNNLALALRNQGKFSDAEKMYLKALDVERKSLPADHPLIATTLNNLAVAVQDQGRLSEAEPLLKQALDMTRKLQGEQHPDYAMCLNNLAKNLGDQDKFPDAEVLFREALEKMRKSLPPKHPAIATALMNVAYTISRQGKLADAIPVFREALAMQMELLDEDNPSVALSQVNLAHVLGDLDRLAEAEPLLRDALGKYRKQFGDEHPDAAKALGNLVDVLMREHKYDEAVKLCNEFLPAELENRPQRSGFLMTRAGLHARRGGWQEAIADAAKAVAIKPDKTTYGHILILLLLANGDREGARQSCQRTLDRFTGTNGPDAAVRMAMDCLIIPPPGVNSEAAGKLADSAVTMNSTNVFYQFCKSLAEYRQGHFASALDWAAKPLESHGHATDDRLHLQAYLVLAMAHWQLKQTDEAKAALAEGVQLAKSKLPTLDSGDIGSGWQDWIISQALMKEAKALIESGAEPTAK